MGLKSNSRKRKKFPLFKTCFPCRVSKLFESRFRRWCPYEYRGNCLEYNALKGLLKKKFARQQRKCIYCCANLRNNGTIAIDRKDNLEGPTEDNIVLCCFVCFILRSADYSFEEFSEARNNSE